MGMGRALALPGLRLIARPDFLRLAGPEARNNACNFTRANSTAAYQGQGCRLLKEPHVGEDVHTSANPDLIFVGSKSYRVAPMNK
jgi:hypothetical protein